jgi:hypothetical protein
MWVVVHFKDGRLLKGFTRDFTPTKTSFHLTSEQDRDRGSEYEIELADLKAIFFVKTLEGNKDYAEKKRFEEVDTSGLKGLKIRVEFDDGEVIRGISLGYSKSSKGFFVIPVDPESNNERIYVNSESLRNIKVGAAAEK